MTRISRSSLRWAARVHWLGMACLAFSVGLACSDSRAIDVNDRIPPEPGQGGVRVADPEDGGVRGVDPSETAPPAPQLVASWVRISPEADAQYLSVGAPDVILLAEFGKGWLTRDGGATWVRLDWPGDLRISVAVDPSGMTIVAGGLHVAVQLEPTVVWSNDGGTTWIDSGRAARPVRYREDDIFFVGGHPAGLLASNDGGASGAVLLDADVLETATRVIRGIALNPLDPSDLGVTMADISGNGSRILRTRGSGAVSVLAAEFGLADRTVLRYGAAGRLYIVSQGVGVLISEDDGVSWRIDNRGLEALLQDGRYPALLDLAVVLGQREVVVLATADGLFTLSDAGWAALEGPGGIMRSLEVRPGPEPSLLAATSDGLWQREVSDLTSVGPATP